MNLKDFLGVGTKLKKTYSKTTANQIHCYNQNIGFVNRMDQNVAKYWHPNKKLVVVPVCLNGRCCYTGCVSSVGINKDKGDNSLSLLAFQRHVVNVNT